MPLKSRNVHSLPQIFHREALVNIRYDRLDEDELLKVSVGRGIRSGNLPLLPINTGRDLGFVNPENSDAGLCHS